MIKVQTIFDRVCEVWSDNSKDCDNDIQNKRRTLRNKYNFLAKNVVFRDSKDFREKGKNVVPEAEAGIIQAILIETVDPDKDNIIKRWFNGRVDITDSKEAIQVYEALEDVIEDTFYFGGCDRVVADEWLSALGSVLNVHAARKVSKIKADIETFRENSLAMSANIGLGDVIYEDEYGRRNYILKGKEFNVDVEQMSIKEMLEHTVFQTHYLDILSAVLALCDKDAREKTYDRIKQYVEICVAFDAQKADDSINDSQLISEYVVWYQRIYEFLSVNPELCKRLEEETGKENLLEFFKMQGR